MLTGLTLMDRLQWGIILVLPHWMDQPNWLQCNSLTSPGFLSPLPTSRLTQRNVFGFLNSLLCPSPPNNPVRNFFLFSGLRLILYSQASLLHSLRLVQTFSHCSGVLLCGPFSSPSGTFGFFPLLLVLSDLKESVFLASLSSQGSHHYFLLGNVSNFDGWWVLFSLFSFSTS